MSIPKQGHAGLEAEKQETSTLVSVSLRICDEGLTSHHHLYLSPTAKVHKL